MTKQTEPAALKLSVRPFNPVWHGRHTLRNAPTREQGAAIIARMTEIQRASRGKDYS
jgi:hypothetical protein